jgi:NTE family protein
MEEIDTLIICGGGMKSCAIIGALNYLDEKGILKNIKKYAGTSAGSFIITLLVINYTPNEIEQTIFSQGNNLIKESYLKVLYNIFKSYGIYSADKMYKYLESLFEAKGFSKNITFKELYEKTGKLLTLTGTSLSEEDTFYFNCYTQPDMKIIDGVRISISIPIYFTSVKYTFNSQIHTLVDGGVLNNFPLYYYDICNLSDKWIFKSSDYQVEKKNLLSKNLFMTKRTDFTNTIGIILHDKVRISSN